MVERGAPPAYRAAGVLESGAAYVPLDPKLPAERLSYMAEDSRARLLLSQGGLRESWLPGLPVLDLDDLPADAPLAPAPALTTGPADLAYILYTSGSTGRPKGVAIPHSALTNLLLSIRETTGFGAADSLLAVTTVSFDIAGLELYLPLVAGGRVVVCDSGTAADGAALAVRIEESGATWMQATPTSWRMLRDAGWTGAPQLNVLCGGEELPLDLAEFLSSRVASLRNVYGPTETTIWSTAGVVEPASGIDIGVPLDNTQLYVLDPQGRSVEPSFPGELWIGGEGLAVGYWDRPELTEERFVTGLLKPRRSGGCTAPVTGRAGPVRGGCCTTGGWTTRSSCAATASSSPRSRRFSKRSRVSPRPSSWSVTTGLSPIYSRRTAPS